MEAIWGVKYKLLVMSFFSAIAGIVSKVIYRPVVLNNHLNDLGLQGVLPNFFTAMGVCLFIAYCVNKKIILAMGCGCLGVLAYETEQIWTSRTFDYSDIIATLIGFMVSIVLFKWNKKQIIN